MRAAFPAAFLSILVLQACCQVNPATGRLQWMLVSTEQEISMGRAAVPEVRHRFGGVYRDATLRRYVHEVGNRLADVCDRPDLEYQFEILNTDIPNAFALPGGFVFITRGLLIRLRSEAQLAGTLGHEIAHVCARHSAARISNAIGLKLLQMGLLIWAAASDVDPEIILAAAVLSEVSIHLILLGFSRSDELEADEIGAEYCYRAGYSPHALVEVLTILEEIEMASGKDEIPSLLRTHPRSRDRIRDLQATLDMKYPKHPAPKEDPEFERSTDRFRREYAAARQYDSARQARLQGRPQEAMALIDSALKDSPDQPAFLLEKARLLEGMNRADEARSLYARVATSHPDDFDALMGLGRIDHSRGRSAAARQSFAAAEKLVPGNPEVHRLLASVYQAEGNEDRAKKERRIYERLTSKREK
jgi:predicted Zn-dependent protease